MTLPEGHFGASSRQPRFGKKLVAIAGGDSGNEWNIVMATAIMAMIPPAIVVIFMQRWFVKGLVDTEK